MVKTKLELFLTELETQIRWARFYKAENIKGLPKDNVTVREVDTRIISELEKRIKSMIKKYKNYY